jgi:hypothetical protein
MPLTIKPQLPQQHSYLFLHGQHFLDKALNAVMNLLFQFLRSSPLLVLQLPRPLPPRLFSLLNPGLSSDRKAPAEQLNPHQHLLSSSVSRHAT